MVEMQATFCENRLMTTELLINYSEVVIELMALVIRHTVQRIGPKYSGAGYDTNPLRHKVTLRLRTTE